MRKLLIGIIVLVLLLMGGIALIPGISLTQLPETFRVGTGLGAKLACSARYLTKQNEAQILKDIASYSPALAQLSIRYDQAENWAEASLFGLSTTRATFREGIGCTLDRGDTSALDKVQLSEFDSVQGPWPKGSDVRTINESVQEILEAALEEDNTAGLNTRALVLVKNGVITAEAYADGYTSETALLGWSMGKSVTAMLLGHLEYRGMLDVSEQGVFPSWKQDERAEITIENMLQMSTGLAFSETYLPGNDSTRMLFVERSAAEFALQRPLIHPPGEHFSYSSGTANMLAKVFADKVGDSPEGWMQFVQENFYEPLGMSHTYLEPDASGVFVGSSYVYASARDWARMGLLMLNGGELSGVRLLSEEWVKRASSPNTSSNDPRYGYQFWLNGGGEKLRWDLLPEDAYAMTGNRGQFVMIIPSEGLVITRLGWTAGWYNTNKEFAAILAAVKD